MDFARVPYSRGLNTISNSYTMVCPSVRGDNPRALARSLVFCLSLHGINFHNLVSITSLRYKDSNQSVHPHSLTRVPVFHLKKH